MKVMRKQIWAVRNHEDHVEVMMSHVLNFPARSPAPRPKTLEFLCGWGGRWRAETGERKELIVASQNRVRVPLSLWCSAKLSCVRHESPTTHTLTKQ